MKPIADRWPWIWALLGVAALWLALSLANQSVSLAPLTAALGASALLVFAALAQSFAMMTAPGNVDLSIPSVVTLSAFVSIGVVGGSDAMALPGLLAGIAVGGIVGLANAACILLLRIPAIIATLATGYILATLSLIENRHLGTNAVAPALRFAAAGHVAGLPVVALIAAGLAAAAGLVYARTGFGRMLLAAGQSQPAAALAGVPVRRVVTLAFVLSGMLAGALGVLLAARSGGAFLDMGSPYLLLSIGAVVIGGTPLFGGRVSVAGCCIGALFLTLLDGVLPVLGVTGGGQEILQGAIIIAVLVAGGLRRPARA